MALTEIARFADLREGQIAKSALTASGFHALLFDEYRASALWTEQMAIGGLRIMVPENEALDAQEFLRAPRRRVMRRSADKTASSADAVALVGMLLACMFIGWPLAGLKRPTVFHRTTALILIFATTIPLALIWFENLSRIH